MSSQQQDFVTMRCLFLILSDGEQTVGEGALHDWLSVVWVQDSAAQNPHPIT